MLQMFSMQSPVLHRAASRGAFVYELSPQSSQDAFCDGVIPSISLCSLPAHPTTTLASTAPKVSLHGSTLVLPYAGG